MSVSNTVIDTNIISRLEKLAEPWESDEIFLITDTNVQKSCLPRLFVSDKIKNCHHIIIPSGDDKKNIETAQQIWQYLSENNATRKSLVINLGGGMVTDIGGFAASTFKRGIEYINVSTTLLGAVDAATGGKTGINFLGYKNEIGTFTPAKKVIINVDFFKTLDNKNLRSGFAEMIKHALISTREDWNDILRFDLDEVDYEQLNTLLARNIEIKESIVAADPKEQGIRKALNLGHTFGHAIESWSYKSEKPVLHGYAVAWGLICELYLSHIKLGFPKEEFLKLKYFVKEHYGVYDCGCNDYEAIIELMKHDKKNEGKEINFTLLSDIGEVKINQTATKEEIVEALDVLI